MFGQPIGRIFVVVVGSICLTIASFGYRYPSNCDDICYGTDCIRRACEFGEQQAGFPKFMVRDSNGYSPTSGWGRIDFDDLYYGFHPGNFILNVAFYGALLWALGSIVQIIRARESIIKTTTLVGIPALIMVLIAFPTLMDIALRPASTVSSRPQNRLVGYWETTDDTTNSPFLLLLNEKGDAVVFVPRLSSGIIGYGRYEIQAHNTLHIALESTRDNFCTMLPTVFDTRCSAIVATPTPYTVPTFITSDSAYPFPEEDTPLAAYAAPSTPTVLPEGYPLPETIAPPMNYPAPTVAPITYSTVTNTFTITLTGDTLILTDEAGTSHTFQHRD